MASSQLVDEWFQGTFANRTWPHLDAVGQTGRECCGSTTWFSGKQCEQHMVVVGKWTTTLATNCIEPSASLQQYQKSEVKDERPDA